MHSPQPKAIVFDLYNTLVHIGAREKPIVQLWKALQMNNREKRLAKNALMQQVHHNMAEMATALVTNADIDLHPLQASLDREIASVHCYYDTKEVLHLLRDKGYPLYLLSNLSQPYAAPINALGLPPFFDDIFLSCTIGMTKPNTHLYNCVAEKIGTAPQELLMVGDSLRNDYLGAKHAGWQSVLIDRHERHPEQPSIKTLTELIPLLAQ